MQFNIFRMDENSWPNIIADGKNSQRRRIVFLSRRTSLLTYRFK